MLSSAILVVSHQPHDQTEGLAVTPDGRYVFTNSRHCLYRSQDAGYVWEKANGRGLPHVASGGGVAIVGAESGDLMVNTKLTKGGWCKAKGEDGSALPLVGRNGLDTRGEWVLIGWMGGAAQGREAAPPAEAPRS